MIRSHVFEYPGSETCLLVKQGGVASYTLVVCSDLLEGNWGWITRSQRGSSEVCKPILLILSLCGNQTHDHSHPKYVMESPHKVSYVVGSFLTLDQRLS